MSSLETVTTRHGMGPTSRDIFPLLRPPGRGGAATRMKLHPHLQRDSGQGNLVPMTRRRIKLNHPIHVLMLNTVTRERRLTGGHRMNQGAEMNGKNARHDEHSVQSANVMWKLLIKSLLAVPCLRSSFHSNAFRVPFLLVQTHPGQRQKMKT